LSRKVAEKLQFLIADIILNGPVRGTWPNFQSYLTTGIIAI